MQKEDFIPGKDASLEFSIASVAALIGLAPDEGSLWAGLRGGELKALLAEYAEVQPGVVGHA